MKTLKFAALCVVGCFAVAYEGAAQSGVSGYGPLTIAIKVTQQADPIVTVTTKKISGHTNVTTTTKYVQKSTKFQTKDVIALLGNSMSNIVTDVSKAKLLIGDDLQFYVGTPGGTNAIDSVMQFEALDDFDYVESGSETTVTKDNVLVSEKETRTRTYSGWVRYDDRKVTTVDGTHAYFMLLGAVTVTYGDAPGAYTTKFSLTGSGGIIHDLLPDPSHPGLLQTFAQMSGTISGTAKGTVDTDDPP